LVDLLQQTNENRENRQVLKNMIGRIIAAIWKSVYYILFINIFYETNIHFFIRTIL